GTPTVLTDANNGGGAVWSSGQIAAITTATPSSQTPAEVPPTNSPDPLGGTHGKAQALTAGGVQVCMGDVSVRNVSPSVSTVTWAVALTPSTSAVLGSDWGQ